MSQYKINRRPKDDDSDEDDIQSLSGINKLAEETINKLDKSGFNGELFMKVLVNKMGEKGMVKSKEIGWKIVHNENKKFYDENGIVLYKI